jgi:hypothetical protein
MEASIQWLDPILLTFVNRWLRRLRRVVCPAGTRRCSLELASARRSDGWDGCARAAALRLARWAVTSRGRSRVSTGPGFFDGLRNAAEALALEPQFEHLAHNLAKVRDVLYLVRGTNYPIALEGALKAQGNFLHPRRRLCRGRTYRVDRRKDAGQRHRALRPPIQKRYNICKKSLPAMARSFS